MASEDLSARLVECGYCIGPDVLPTATIDSLNADLDPVFAATPFGQGRFYGYRTKRFGGLLKRSAHAETLALEPTTLGAVQAILGSACDRLQLNVAQASEIPPAETRQFPQFDHDIWNGAPG